MCSGPRKQASHPQYMTESSLESLQTYSLLELAASNDLPAFKHAVEIDSYPIDGVAQWYCRFIGSSKLISADRTPLMIAALYGSADVLRYIVQSVDVNRRSDTDGATALHLAAAGGSSDSADAVRILLDASANVDALDACGRRPGDVIAKQSVRSLDLVLKASFPRSPSPMAPREEERKKEYPADLTLPDIKNGIYGTDEFRIYTFKVKPCSRAYSHDWTECPFVHPGENARRRDPRKYVYSCVPCPEFRKGSCRNGDSCEYAHGVFECWLHPDQYRTRLCKDETGCNRRVCFFAHKPEELRSVNHTAASVNAAGLVIPSPRSSGVSNLEMAAAAYLLSPMSPSLASTGMGTPRAWMGHAPSLQLQSSRLKSAMSARDLDAEFELMGLEGYQMKLLDEIQSAAAASPRSSWPSTAAGNLFSSQLAQSQSQSHQLLSGYSSDNLPSSATLNSSTAAAFGLDHSMVKAIMNSRAAAFTKRSQSFCDRGASAARVAPSGLSSAAGMRLSHWGSPDGKLDWGMQGEELNKLRKSASFGYRSSQTPLRSVSPPKAVSAAPVDEPDLSWVQSLVKDGAVNRPASRGQQQQQQYQMNGAEMYSGPWGEEQLVA